MKKSAGELRKTVCQMSSVLADRRRFPLRPAHGGRAPAAVTAVRLRRRKSNLRFNARVPRVYSAPKTISADRNIAVQATAGKRERSEPRTFGAQRSGPQIRSSRGRAEA